MADNGTAVTIRCGEIVVIVETTASWTPEYVDHMMTRMRRQAVAAARQLGFVAEDTDAEVETPEADDANA